MTNPGDAINNLAKAMGTMDAKERKNLCDEIARLELQLSEVTKQRDVFALGMSPVVDSLRVELKERELQVEELQKKLAIATCCCGPREEIALSLHAPSCEYMKRMTDKRKCDCDGPVGYHAPGCHSQ